MSLEDLQVKEYDLRLEVNRLRRQVYGSRKPPSEAELEELAGAEAVLTALENDLINAAQQQKPDAGLILSTKKESLLLGVGSTGLEATVHLRMEYLPTSFYHLLNKEDNPLLSCTVVTADKEKIRRVRVTSFVEGYSARAIESMELDWKGKRSHEFKQLPTLNAESIGRINELTRATLNVQVDDLDGQVEIHKTVPVWLLARTTGYLSVKDPTTQKRVDMTRYLGAFVTPNEPSVMAYERRAADYHPKVSLVGYQGGAAEVRRQVNALYDVLKDAGIVYVNSVINFHPEDGASSQRVRLPKESLADRQANCIDGTVLFASLIEGISMNPAIVIVPGHAFVGWETGKNSGQWNYLETTMVGKASFADACKSAESTAAKYKATNELRQWSLRELRTKYGITPME